MLVMSFLFLLVLSAKSLLIITDSVSAVVTVISIVLSTATTTMKARATMKATATENNR